MSQNQPPAPTPYGVQQQTQVYIPPVKQPGSASSKVWGILLIVFGLFSLLNMLASLGMMISGASGAAFVPGADEQLRQQLDQATAEVTASAIARWSFWVSNIGEFVVIGLSLAAGFLLALRPRPIGRKLAIARALLVLILVPVVAFEISTMVEEQSAMQERIMRASLEGQPGSGAVSPDEIIEGMRPIMRAAGYGAAVLVIVVSFVVNGLLLYFMTRPAVSEYLKNAAEGKTGGIPQFDPSMGIIHPAPEQASPPPPPPDGHHPPGEPPNR